MSPPDGVLHGLAGCGKTARPVGTGARPWRQGRSTKSLKMVYKTKLVIRFLNKLKELDIYEQATIVILSDHGSGRHQSTRSFSDPKSAETVTLAYSEARANTLLMVNSGVEKVPEITDKSMQLNQLRGLINHLVSGKTLVSYIDQLPEQSVRRFFTYGWRDLHPYVKNYKESIIVKPIWEKDAFIRYHRHEMKHEVGTCLFDRAQIDGRDSYLGQWPFQVSTRNQIRFELPKMESADQDSGYIVLGQLNAKGVGSEAIKVALVQNNTVKEERAVSQEKPYFEFDIRSNAYDLSKPFTIRSEAVANIKKLHVFAAQFNSLAVFLVQ